MSPDRRSVSRRLLLRETGLVAAGLAAGSLMPRQSQAAPAPAESLRQQLTACEPGGDPLQALVAGNRRFAAAWKAASGPMDNQVRRRLMVDLLADNCQLDPTALAKGQKPWAAILSCADSRVPTEILFHRGPGELFNVRCAGNTAFSDGVASLEYAVEVLGVPLILVMGHSGCGAVEAAMDPNASLTPLLTDLVKPIRASLVPGEPLPAAIRTNARYATQAMLRKSELLAGAKAAGRVRVQAAYFDIGSGQVSLL
ncbi:carbonic anhydrase [Synechococcus sp. CS-1328]|uniref:carbonic anhydrase n=1 Tax=Synechococcus sp. CS-1328 TaxID=2847976 RepID=UPI00223BFA7F|nr:carbonic anhydrase [Synechococcus sp. CS-1328]MCT0223801.1 carbonic anhydrase [Synechococcus sp. CS-1328]